MLRDYALSLTIVALILLGYTALVLTNKKNTESRTAASVPVVNPVEAAAPSVSATGAEPSSLQ